VTERTIRLYGLPAPKGSLRCVGRRGRRAHVLIEDNKNTKPWRDKVAYAGRRLRITEPWTGPIGVEVTVTVPRPATVRREGRPWPVTRSSYDVDKLARVILDGLQDAQVFRDDSQIVELTIRKAYPDTDDCPDRLDNPGACIRLYPFGDNDS
jgi:Holliday junction resolvase RusA-like endonuclease